MKKTISKASKMIRTARLRKGWTQRELGLMLGHSYGNFIGMLESGSAQIPVGIIVPISNLLGLDPKKLLREVMICRHPDLAKYL